MAFCYNLSGLEDNELTSQLCEQESKGEEAGCVGSVLTVGQVP